MKQKLLKRICITAAAIVVVLSAVLAVHLYHVFSNKKKADSSTIAMARIDFKQPISSADGSKISVWLYQQKGVTQVLCNDSAAIAVFSYHLATNNADSIIAALKTTLNYTAERFIPDQASLKSGCPAGF